MRIAGKWAVKVKKKYAYTASLVNWAVRDTKLLFELQNTSCSFVEKLAIMEQLILTKFNNLPTDIQQQVLDYIEFLLAKHESRTKGIQNEASVPDALFQNLDPGHPLWKAIRPLRSGVTAQDLIEEQGYLGTDWKRLEQLAKEMDIQEPLEDLLTQLTA